MKCLDLNILDITLYIMRLYNVEECSTYFVLSLKLAIAEFLAKIDFEVSFSEPLHILCF